jgi:hypothetical protein
MMPRSLALWLLPRYANGSLPGPVARAVAAAIDVDVDVAVAYRALRAAERPAHGGLSGAQKDFILGNVLAAVGAEPAAERDAATARSSSVTARGAWMPLAAAAACVGLFVVAKPADLTARGDGKAPLGVRVRCVKDGAVVDDAAAGARQTGADLACDKSGLLAFSTTNLHSAPRYAFVVGVDDHGGRVWLPPFGKDAAALAIAANSADTLIETLAPMPTEGVTLFVLLDDAPFHADDVARRLDAADRNGVPLQSLDKLPLDVLAQGRLVVRVR